MFRVEMRFEGKSTKRELKELLDACGLREYPITTNHIVTVPATLNKFFTEDELEQIAQDIIKNFNEAEDNPMYLLTLHFTGYSKVKEI